MFVGHYAVALVAKRVAPRASLGTLFFAAQFLDLLWPLLLLTNVEHVRIDPGNTTFTPLDFYDYPISHSLLMTLLWGAVIAVLYFAVRRRGATALVVGGVVVSHWVLDYLTHRADLPLTLGGPARVGLGLWYSVTWTMIVEGTMFVGAVIYYVRGFRSTDKYGHASFWTLKVLLAVFWLAAAFGPPPPSEDAIGSSALLLWLLVPWGYWIDRHRAHASVNS